MAVLARRRNPRGLEARADSGTAGDRGQLPSGGRVARRIALHGLPDAEPLRPGRGAHVQDLPQANRPPSISEARRIESNAEPTVGSASLWAGATPAPGTKQNSPNLTSTRPRRSRSGAGRRTRHFSFFAPNQKIVLLTCAGLGVWRCT